MLLEVNAKIIKAVLQRVQENNGEFCTEDGVALLATGELDILQQASDLVERKKVTKYSTKESNRKYYHVQGSMSQAYFCFTHYCSCPAFAQIVSKSTDAVCKHIVAIWLGEALGCIPSIAVEEDSITSAWQNAFNDGGITKNLGKQYL